MPNSYYMDRRRFIQIAAASATGLGLVGCGDGREAGPLVPYEWSGRLLGADASVILYHQHDAVSIAALKEITAEVKRLAGILTIYVQASELSRLNKNGELRHASPELLEVLAVSRRLWRESEGLFDPTVQPLYELYANYYSEPRAEEDIGPDSQTLAKVRKRIGLNKVIEADGDIRFTAEGMALSFNGIAQGYLTDCAHDILKKRGFHHALVNMGEYRAIGGKPQPDGAVAPWQIGIADAKAPWQIFETLEVTDKAVSTSAPSGAAFNTKGNAHHLFNPKTGLSENRYLSVTVVAPTATIADGLSTVLALMPPEQAREILAKFDGAGALLRPLEGPPVRINL